MCLLISVFSLYFENTEFVISKESQGKHTGGEYYASCIFLSINMESFYVENINSVKLSYEHKIHTLFILWICPVNVENAYSSFQNTRRVSYTY